MTYLTKNLTFFSNLDGMQAICAEKVCGKTPPVITTRCQIPLFVAARHLPPAGGSRPLGWGLWHNGTVSGSSAKFAGAPETPSSRELAKPSGFD